MLSQKHKKMAKADLGKLYKRYYAAGPAPELQEFGLVSYLSVSGKGDPSSPAFAERIQALYSTAYGVKFACKAAGNDFTVPKLEGLWWFDEALFGNISMADAPAKIPRSEWEYRLLIRMPEFVTAGIVAEASRAAATKKGIVLASEVGLIEMREGKVVQMLHVGPFDKEPETLKIMQEYMVEHSLAKKGLHHEIYLSDFRKTDPGKLRTILREPVK